jgi:hypothetical protein
MPREYPEDKEGERQDVQLQHVSHEVTGLQGQAKVRQKRQTDL